MLNSTIPNHNESANKQTLKNVYVLSKLLGSVRILALAESTQKWKSTARAIDILRPLRSSDFKNDEASQIFFQLVKSIPNGTLAESEIVQYQLSGAAKLARSQPSVRKTIFRLFELEFNSLVET